jgi:hypothetical protein
MTSPTDALITPLSFDEIRASIYNVLAATGVTTSTWKPGAVVRTIISGVAIVLAGLSAFIALLAASAFLPLATGEWLRLVALYVFNVVRIEATFATGSVTLVNNGRRHLQCGGWRSDCAQSDDAQNLREHLAGHARQRRYADRADRGHRSRRGFHILHR